MSSSASPARLLLLLADIMPEDAVLDVLEKAIKEYKENKNAKTSHHDMQRRNKCKTPYCRNKTVGGRKHCSTCRCRKSREKNPLAYAYHNLKSSARKRNKPFTITIEYFAQFCTEYNYLAGKGRSKTCLSVDCIINELGYVPGNLRTLPMGENSAKGTKVLEYDWETKFARVVTHEPATKDFLF